MTPAQASSTGTRTAAGRHRLRRAVNLINGTTAAGILVARTGGLRLRRGPEGILLAGGWKHRLPYAAAFTLGNVVIYRPRVSAAFVPSKTGLVSPLLRHEARHSTQYALLGLAFLPLYFAAAGISQLRSGNPASSNIFEILAGLDDGGYRHRGTALPPAG
ncbi:hypothetical protein H9638_03475 [Arthrobacter sp. Sa2BUA2]|uniref:DUF4157 domain-containing protein n=1 Tax=Arthrobacter pullicola TaxID=2762224 RepID=A0ABR8YF87_9MICC|nr:hypothetical protein [Arthrobacter pullicola]MBD8042868.1 hypothetical protein [Arthrobacter pullicola]